MQYIDSIIDAAKQIIGGEFTTGNLMVIGGCILLVTGIIQVLRFLGGYRKQREKMFKELREG